MAFPPPNVAQANSLPADNEATATTGAKNEADSKVSETVLGRVRPPDCDVPVVCDCHCRIQRVRRLGGRLFAGDADVGFRHAIRRVGCRGHFAGIHGDGNVQRRIHAGSDQLGHVDVLEYK